MYPGLSLGYGEPGILPFASCSVKLNTSELNKEV